MREATADDIPLLVDMGRKFHAASNQFCDYSEAATGGMLARMIEAEEAVVLISEKGLIGGVLSPAYCADNWKMAVELFWWAEDRQGLRLLKGFEDWAALNGANEIRMTTLTNLTRADELLRRKGYAPLEISYGKAI